MIFIFKRLIQLLQREQIAWGQELIEVSNKVIAEVLVIMETSTRLVEKEIERNGYCMYVGGRSDRTMMDQICESKRQTRIKHAFLLEILLLTFMTKHWSGSPSVFLNTSFLPISKLALTLPLYLYFCIGRSSTLSLTTLSLTTTSM